MTMKQAPDTGRGGDRVLRSTAPEDRRDKRRLAAEMRQRLQPLTRLINRAEADIQRLHSERENLEIELTDNSLYGDGQKARLKALLLQKAAIDRSLEKAEAEWLAASEKSEALKNSL